MSRNNPEKGKIHLADYLRISQCLSLLHYPALQELCRHISVIMTSYLELLSRHISVIMTSYLELLSSNSILKKEPLSSRRWSTVSQIWWVFTFTSIFYALACTNAVTSNASGPQSPFLFNTFCQYWTCKHCCAFVLVRCNPHFTRSSLQLYQSINYWYVTQSVESISCLQFSVS